MTGGWAGERVDRRTGGRLAAGGHVVNFYPFRCLVAIDIMSSGQLQHLPLSG